MVDETRILHKRSDQENRSPDANDLSLGEIAVNTHDGRMFIKRDRDGSEEIVPIGEEGAVDRVYYVSKNGNDSNGGQTLGDSFRTLDQAITTITQEREDFLSENPNEPFRSTIYLKTGDYTVSNPLSLPPFTTIIGDNLRSVTIVPETNNEDIFYVNTGCYIAGITFRGFVSPAAAVAYDPNPNTIPVITSSPYIQNCSCITTTGTGMRIDGSVVGGLRSMLADGYTQFNENGIGVHLLNRGYAQLVSIFTIACDKGILTQSGGQCSLSNSNCSFGNFGLVSEGVSNEISSGTVSGSYIIGSTNITVASSTMPKYNQAVLFDSEPNRYYTVLDVVESSNTNEYVVTLLQPIDQPVPDSTTVRFFQRSLITASAITFEYVGAGTDIPAVLPQNGGIPIQENEVVDDEDFGGQVYFTSTDQLGDFRIGNQLTISRADGTITGTAFDRSLFNVLTPYILALED